jgi:hypothetical protein
MTGLMPADHAFDSTEDGDDGAVLVEAEERATEVDLVDTPRPS